MGEFDDVLAMEPGDEWDDHVPGAEPERHALHHAPLLAELRLPGAVVSVRGELDRLRSEELLAPLGDLASPSLQHWHDAPERTLGLVEDGADLVVVEPERGELARVGPHGDPVAALLGVLGELAVRRDPLRLHLAAACVEVRTAAGTFGVALLDADRARRHRSVAALLDEQAAYLGADDTVLLHGSRTVFAHPVPLQLADGDGFRWVPASTRSLVVPHCAIRVVLFDGGELGGASPVRIAAADGCARLLEEGLALERFGPAALDVVAPMVADAELWAVDMDDVGGWCELLASIDVLPGRSPVSVAPSDAVRAEGRASGPAGRASGPDAREARFVDGAVRCDPAAGEVDVLADAGAAPGRADSGPGDVDPERSAQVRAVLDDALDVLDAAGLVPIVHGPAVLAQDGPLPADLVEVEVVELLVDEVDAARCADVLAEAGYSSVDRTRVDEDPQGASGGRRFAELVSPAGAVPVRIHTQLSVGPFGELVDHGELRRRSVPVLIGDRWTRALHPEDRFVLACVRLAEVPAGEPIGQAGRQVLLLAPSSEALLAEVLEASERWGATTTVLDAVRRVDAELEGLPRALVRRASGADTSDRGRRARRRRRA